MHGTHLIADLYDCLCAPALLVDTEYLETLCREACRQHELTVVGQYFHTFLDAAGEPAGVTGAVVLAESHLAIHTWPELAGVTLDVYVCNFSADNSQRAQALFDQLIALFSPGRKETQRVIRGRLGR